MSRDAPYFAIVSAWEPDLKVGFDALDTTWAVDHPDDWEYPFAENSKARTRLEKIQESRNRCVVW